MSSVRELEIQSAGQRKKLMQALFNHLVESGVEVELTSEAAANYLGMSFQESVIQIQKKNLNTIRLIGIDGGGCGVPGNIMRFQFEVHLNKVISSDLIEKIDSETRLVKAGKLINLFGGKVTGVKWSGKEFAGLLNKDTLISEAMLKCNKSWNYIEFNIEATSSQINILGPRFSEPERMIQIYRTELKNEIECCLFGFQLVEKIAGHLKEYIA